MRCTLLLDKRIVSLGLAIALTMMLGCGGGNDDTAKPPTDVEKSSNEASSELDPNSLAYWKKQFEGARVEIDEMDPVTRTIIIDGLTLFEPDANQTEFAGRWQAKDLIDADDVLTQMAGSHSRVERTELAENAMESIQSASKKLIASYIVVNVRINKGDIDGALTLAESLGDRKDICFASIAKHYQAEQSFEKAAQFVARIANEELRKKESERLEREERRPRIADPDYVAETIEWGMAEAKRRQKKFAGARELLDIGLPDDATVSKLLRQSALARKAHHDKQPAKCLEALNAAFVAASSFKQADMRIPEQLSTACLAHKLEQSEWAKDKLKKLTEDESTDEYYLAAQLSGLRVTDALVATFSDEELMPLIARFQDDEFPSELLSLADALCKRNELKRLANLLNQVKRADQRLMICNAAAEAIIRSGN